MIKNLENSKQGNNSQSRTDPKDHILCSKANTPLQNKGPVLVEINQSETQIVSVKPAKSSFRQKLRAFKRKKDGIKKALCNGPKRIMRKYLVRNRKKAHEKDRDCWKEHQEMEESFVESEKEETQSKGTKFNELEQCSFDQNSSYNLTSSNGEKLAYKHSNRFEVSQSVLSPVTEGRKLHFKIVRRNKLLYPQFDLLDQHNYPVIFCKKTSLLSFTFSLKAGDWEQSSESYIGKLISNISGSALNFLMKATHKEEKEKPICSIEYTNSIFDFKKPRTIKVFLLNPVQHHLHPKIQSLREVYDMEGQGYGVVYLQNMLPTYNKSKGYSLDFHGRAPVSSIKNFILESPKWRGKEYLLLGKRGQDEYNLDFMHPLSMLSAFAVAVSNFNGKLVCE